jgi:Chain length determinant protein
MDPAGINGQTISSKASAGGNGAVHLTEAQYSTLQLLRYLNLLRSRWILIVTVTLGFGLGYGLYTKFLTVKWYRAQTTITPTGIQSVGFGGGAGSDMIDGMGGGLASLLSFGGGDSVTTAERYIAIMNSYAFTTNLIARYQLTRNIIGVRSKNAPTQSKWSLHTALVSRFTTEYDYKSGNLSLYFLDPSPADAQRILGYYLDSLRDKLRNEEVQSAASSADALQEEVRKTSDALLQNQLYELMARQIQREKVAQVQADFAFKVVEPPVVPENYYAPKARHNAILASSLTFTMLCFWIISADFVRRAKAQYQALTQEQEQSAVPGSTVGEPPWRPEEPVGPHPRFVRNLRPKS